MVGNITYESVGISVSRADSSSNKAQDSYQNGTPTKETHCNLIVAAIGTAELKNETLKNELAKLRELRVDDSNHCRIHMGESRGGSLSLNAGARKQTPKEHGITNADRMLG